MIMTILLAAWCLVLAIAAISDARHFRIPNILPLLLILLFVARIFLAPPATPLWEHGVHFLVALAAGMLLFKLRWIGGGDAKLYAATALWFGLSDGLLLLFAMTACGVVITIISLASRILRLRKGGGAAKGKLDRRIAYGIAIAFGGIATALSAYIPL